MRTRDYYKTCKTYVLQSEDMKEGALRDANQHWALAPASKS